MSTHARTATRAVARSPNPVEDELVGEDEGDMVEVPGAVEFGARPRGAGALQNIPDIDGGGEDLEDRREIIEGDGERGATGGDVT